MAAIDIFHELINYKQKPLHLKSISDTYTSYEDRHLVSPVIPLAGVYALQVLADQRSQLSIGGES